MKWLKQNFFEKVPNLPDVDEISVEMPAVSEYLDAFRLPEAFKVAESDTLPVIDVKGNIVGIVSEYDLAKVIPEWSFLDESYRYSVKVGDIMTKNVWTETEHTNIEDILPKIHLMHTRVIPIVDPEGGYTGKAITRTKLIDYLTKMVKPRSIGGLATPLGVYMTDGKHMAGAKTPGLILTGVVFAVAVIIIQLAAGTLFSYIQLPQTVMVFIELTLFILLLRLTPLVRIHAAEHQTIHAIEKGLPLTRETVRMQPRAHRRCGTNIMVLLIGIQLVIILTYDFSLHKYPFLQFIVLILGFLLVFSNWRQVGMWLQDKITTVPATDAQIDNAIQVGEELLKEHKEDTDPKPPNLLDKIWNMGIIQIILSFLTIIWLADFLTRFL